MIVRYIQSLINGNSSKIIEQGAIEESKKPKENKLIDVSQEVLRSQAANQSEELQGIVKFGWPLFKKRKFRNSAKKRVWNVIARSLGMADDDIVDEITDKIVDVVENDPHYQEVFNEFEQK
ncbi:MAG: hypothetical protein ABH859_05175 [Pseudomonadota bacterium]